MADKLVVDTCVFVEGLFGEENNSSAQLLAQLDTLGVRLIFSQEMIGELLYILKREGNKIGLNDEEIMDILTDAISLFQKGKSTNTKFNRSHRVIRVIDPDDQMFIDAAFSSNATHIITLDKKSGILSLTGVPFSCYTPQTYIDSKNSIEQSS
ncbi:putative toxin-antitoxin system toxin component, PIN family [Metabacillus halosaccharovorans]|uniref:putative toxin-antitoxin system toxin component, PIN family n=1 Tax=Metabacillus halosaccharovorans TaxID=930124 RepID=UPI0034CF62D4